MNNEDLQILANNLRAQALSIEAKIQPEAPILQKIDLERCIESAIDCEFTDNEEDWYVATLESIEHGHLEPYTATNGDTYEKCRPRMNHIHASPEGWIKCPVPEGYRVKVYTGSTSFMHAINKRDAMDDWHNIRMFKIIKVMEGYEI